MAEKSNGPSLFLIVLLVVIIAAGTSYGFMTFFSNNQEKVVANTEKLGPTYTLGDFVVNLGGTGGYQFIKASVVVEVDTKDVVAELDRRSPQIRDMIITVLREQKVMDIEEPGAEIIKNQIEIKLNEVLASGQIKNVWFTQLVVQ